MKSRLLLLCFLMFFPSVFSQQNLKELNVTLPSQNLTVGNIINYLEERYSVMFSYIEKDIPLSHDVILTSNQLPLMELLSKMFAGTDVEFTLTARQIILKKVLKNKTQVTISGYVRESGSSELLIGVTVFIPEFNRGTVTNTYGFYSITIPSNDSATLLFSYVGYNTIEQKTSLKQDQTLNFFMSPNVKNLEAIVVTDKNSQKQSESVKMSTINIPADQVLNIPSLLGEKDVLKVLQLMPGVQKGTEGNSGIYVRGGGPDQNLVILDDAVVYNMNHLFGFFSLFNGDALKSIELTKGGFPPRYGGRLSSVLEINMKEGNKEQWHFTGGIGLISSRLTLEGPLKKNKSSILISARRTYADLIVRPFMKKAKTGYYFYDLNSKINCDFSDKDRLYLSNYLGQDDFFYRNPGEDNRNSGFYWGNVTSTLRWNHLFSNKIFSNASLIFSKFKFDIFDGINNSGLNKFYSAEYFSGIRDWTLKYDIDLIPCPQHWIKTGFATSLHSFTPYAYLEDDSTKRLHDNIYQKTNAIESGLYIEDTWQPVQRVKILGGMRYTHYFSQHTFYSRIEPRLSVAWRLANEFALKASYANMNQYIHLLSNTGLSLPTDLWVPTTKKIKPGHSEQFAAGFVKDLDKPDISISVEGYYKTMNHIIGYKEGATFLLIEKPQSASEFSWEDNTTSGFSWSYGSEFLIQKKEGKFNGWIGYTLSWTQMRFDSINQGKNFYAHYDRRHDISLVGIYHINKKITFSATWVYSTGNSITIPISAFSTSYPVLDGIYTYENKIIVPKEVNKYANKNSFRTASYQRLDLSIQFHKQTRWGERTWEISVYNAYNRMNPFYYNTEMDENKIVHLKQYSLFPIIPSVTYSFKF